jgi:hypothetical protein
MKSYSDAAPFDSSMFVHFRERIGVKLINKINEKMVKEQTEVAGAMVEKKSSEISEAKNQGKLISCRTFKLYIQGGRDAHPTHCLIFLICNLNAEQLIRCNLCASRPEISDRLRTIKSSKRAY